LLKIFWLAVWWLQVRTGGKKLPEAGANFFAPTVLTDVSTDALVRFSNHINANLLLNVHLE
jgi:hypothetical protein